MQCSFQWGDKAVKDENFTFLFTEIISRRELKWDCANLGIFDKRSNYLLITNKFVNAFDMFGKA